jgi:hypothetical protein
LKATDAARVEDGAAAGFVTGGPKEFFSFRSDPRTSQCAPAKKGTNSVLFPSNLSASVHRSKFGTSFKPSFKLSD